MTVWVNKNNYYHFDKYINNSLNQNNYFVDYTVDPRFYEHGF